MTPRAVTVRWDVPVPVAVERMRRYGFSALPVVDEVHRLVGIVSLIDVLRFREDYGHDDVRVEVVMNPDVITTKPTVNASAIAQRMNDNGSLRVMPVVDRGELVGVVTRSDLLQPRSEHGKVAKLLRRITGKEEAYKEVLLGLTQPQRSGPPPDHAAPIRDVMTRAVITVEAERPASEAVDLLLRNRFTALPVIDARRALVGLISEADLLADRQVGRMAQRSVGSVMTRTPVSVQSSATVSEVRSLFAGRGLRMVPVLDGPTLAGVVSRSDLV